MVRGIRSSRTSSLIRPSHRKRDKCRSAIFRILPALLVCAIGCMSLVGCATTSGDTDRYKKPEMKITEPAEPPARVQGLVVGLPDGNTNSKAASCYQYLGVPREGGYFIDDDKMLIATELRVYAEESFLEASKNHNLCSMWNDTFWNQLVKAQKKLDDIEEERQSWWYQNKGTVYIGGGFVVGVGSTILIVYGLNSVTK